MKQKFLCLFGTCLVSLFLLTGCQAIGEKGATISSIYGVTTVFSLLLLIGYFFSIKKKNFWFIVLFISVFVVNSGYLWLSVSNSLQEALWANRVSYLGSVFLPLSMIMTVMKVSKLHYKKWIPYVLFAISVIVYLIAASPGILTIYYESVALETINGVSVLVKDYGSWHCVYLFYLLGYFFLMGAITLHAIIKKKIESTSHAIILIVAVFVNLCVWLLEQLVKIDFEILSVSYIISELFLIGVYLMIQQQEAMITNLQEKFSKAPEKLSDIPKKDAPEFLEHCEYIIRQFPTLTASERTIYNCYLAGLSTKEVLEKLHIAENTLKFHNKNLYGKLGVSSRKQLLEYARAIEQAKN